MAVDLVYSAATGRLRRVIVPSSGHPFHSGEVVLTISDSQYQSFSSPHAIDAFVQTASGIIPANDRYVAVDATGNVVSAHIADPACGDLSPLDGSPLVLHATARVHDLIIGGRWIANRPVRSPANLMGIVPINMPGPPPAHNRRQHNLPLP